MPTLITGSFAYDTIMVFQDQFKNHILPDQVHILNVCFFVPDMRKEFGGCSGNISYNLKLLGGDPLPMGTVGEDFKPYRKWLKKQDIDITHITEVENTYTAQAFLTTDTDNNQIIAFHPGAMNYAHKNRVGDARGVTLGIVAPDGRDAMVEHAEQFAEAGIPWIFDPGQGLPMFSGEELMTFVEQATYLCVNDYESRLLVDKTGRNLPDIAAEVDALIVTRGGSGAEIMVDGTTLDIPVVSVREVNDPTGCGDAFRSGLLHGIDRGFDWQTTGRLASLMGGIKIEHHGTQNHRPRRQEIADRFKENFGHHVDL
ncbi:MAG: carbohydrate kinase family protein [Gammaproteobacteria bacterium]|nr:carbohydrate kinase family protein [Gammaproteobacteria bacterium]MYG66820.1 carbohydrate kinase family protein [Gammaproteobacteria bacterium]MYH91974.1 carbohydrate kinase family protein [Gammaproteobacteria bacterium]